MGLRCISDESLESTGFHYTLSLTGGRKIEVTKNTDGTYSFVMPAAEAAVHPVIFLTGKNETGDKVEGFGRGGDYYLTKPYDMDELLAVAARLIQRQLQTAEGRERLTVIRRGALVLDIPRARATVEGRNAALTAKEFALLLFLVQNEEHEVSPRRLYEAVWGARAENDTRTVRFHIANLRKKLHADDARDFDIVSSYGKGYLFTTFR